MNGQIFDIQRGSFVDGPGIRTVVFFKGCNMRCAWCHNPESWQSKTQILFYETLCSRCSRCFSVCPAGAVGVDMKIDRTVCLSCGACAEACLSGAKKLCGRNVSAEELMQIIRQDKPFYEPDGGVTFSGGECMMQVDFLKNVLEKCASEGIHTAVDTAGNVEWVKFEKILSVADLFLYDIKCMNREKHKRFTGSDNTQILNNLSKLLTLCPEKVIIRVPVINEVNASDDDMDEIRVFLSSYPKPLKIELLPYHRMGEGKHAALDDNAFFSSEPPMQEIIEKWQKQMNEFTKQGRI